MTTWLLLFIQPLSSHEHFHLFVEGERAVVLAKAVQQLGVLEHRPLVAHCERATRISLDQFPTPASLLTEDACVSV